MKYMLIGVSLSKKHFSWYKTGLSVHSTLLLDWSINQQNKSISISIKCLRKEHANKNRVGKNDISSVGFKKSKRQDWSNSSLNCIYYRYYKSMID